MQCFACMFYNKEKYLKLLYSELRKRDIHLVKYDSYCTNYVSTKLRFILPNMTSMGILITYMNI